MEFKYIVLFLLLLIIASLGRALFHLSGGRGETSVARSKGVARALSVRIALSLALFLLLIVGYFRGWIKPHSAADPAHGAASTQRP